MNTTTRSLHLTDLFEIKCKRCGSINVDISSSECDVCGSTIEIECNNCNLKYDYHDFKQIGVTYDNKGKEISNDLDLNKL